MIELIQRLHADKRVSVIFEHDTDIYDVLQIYPGMANAWKEKEGRWLGGGDI